MSELPGDYNILSRWFNLIRAARSSAKSAGYSIITVKVLVDERGNPILWGDIESNRIHPLHAREFMRNLIDKM